MREKSEMKGEKQIKSIQLKVGMLEIIAVKG